MKRHINLHYQVMVKCFKLVSFGLVITQQRIALGKNGHRCRWGCQFNVGHCHAVSSMGLSMDNNIKITASGTRKWPTDTCRPFLYKIFPTFSPHLPIILQKVFRKRPILLSKSADVIRYRFLFHRLFLSAAEFICKAESNELGD